MKPLYCVISLRTEELTGQLLTKVEDFRGHSTQFATALPFHPAFYGELAICSASIVSLPRLMHHIARRATPSTNVVFCVANRSTLLTAYAGHEALRHANLGFRCRWLGVRFPRGLAVESSSGVLRRRSCSLAISVSDPLDSFPR